MSNSSDLRFLAGGGEMGERIRAFDWSDTPLGPPESWSPTLRMMTTTMLANRFPMLLWWGPHYISLYNDAYIPILGTKHPESALGIPVKDCWSEIWDTLKPLIDTPFQGGPATWMEDLPLDLNRHGFVEETHFTIAYSPVPDESASGGIGGVLATVHEITDSVIADRHMLALRDLDAGTIEAKSAEEVCRNAARALALHAKDIPFALIYLVDAEQKRARLAGAFGVATGGAISPLTIDLGEPGNADWPLVQAQRSGVPQIVRHLGERFGAELPGAALHRPDSAVVLPIRSGKATEPFGLLVAGISGRVKFQALHESFLDLLATRISTAIANAHAHEQERRRAEDLAEIDRAKTAFFSNISHEFRTPLSLIMGPIADLLARKEQLPGDRFELELIQRNSQRLSKLVNALLDFSRIEAGRMQATFEPTDIAALTADLASVFRSATQKAGLRLTVDCPPLPQAAYVDREMWETIVHNLMSNALKFTFEGEIEVVLRDRGERVELTVRDTGIGIPDAELPRLFERFHRVRGARSRSHDGSGIGLSLVKQLIRLHGGETWVESREGAGSTFTVSLPTGSAHLPAGQISAAPRPYARNVAAAGAVADALVLDSTVGPELSAAISPSQGRPRILIADDNADMRAYLRRLLATHYQVEVLDDGQAALERAQAHPPDLLLSDVVMPRRDGFALLRQLRGNERTRGIPVILLSARAGEEAREEGLDAGADDYLVKPFSARDLLARVRSQLDLSRLRRQGEERYRALLDSMNEGYCLLEVIFDEHDVPVDYRFLEVNPSFEKLTGMHGALGRRIREFAPDIEQHWLDKYGRVARTGEPMRHANEAKDLARWFDVSAFRSGGPAGSNVAVFFNDITERRQAEIALRESEERYRTLFGSIDEGFCVVEMLFDEHDKPLDYRFVEVNPTFEKQTGLLQATGKRMRELVPDIEDHWIEIYGRVALTGETSRFVSEAKAMDGRWFDVYACRVGGPGSRQVAIVFNDITERRKIAETLAELQRRRDEALTERLSVANAEIVARRELLRRLAQVEEDERRAIHREMHDRIGQDLASAKLNIDLARAHAQDPVATGVRLEAARNLVQNAIDNSRDIMAELRPPGLDDHGLAVALELYAGEVAKHLSIPVAVHALELEQRLPRLVETTLFRIAQEAISNLAKHSNARNVEISLYEEAQEVRLTIADDGSGFDFTGLPEAGRYGFKIMRERAEAVDARLEIEAAPGRGTRITAILERTA